MNRQFAVFDDQENTGARAHAGASRQGTGKTFGVARPRTTLGALDNVTSNANVHRFHAAGQCAPSNAAVRAQQPSMTQRLQGILRPRSSSDVDSLVNNMGALRMTQQAVAPAVRDIDAQDMDNPQEMVEYIAEIMEYLFQREVKYAINPDYMRAQKDITPKMRTVLIDWLVEVHYKFRLRKETMYLTVNVLDRFLAKKLVSRSKLQLVGVTAMLLACKYEEIYTPEVNDFVYITDNAFKREEILQMEQLMIATLDFNFSVPTAYTFFARFCKAGGVRGKTEKLAAYLMELTLQEYSMLRHVPSVHAAAAVHVALKAMNMPWNATLTHHTGYSERDLRSCSGELLRYANSMLYNNNLTAMRRKYSTSKFGEVAKIPLPTQL